ncbi:hypothetical protein N7509_010016 [Penicillium cosmopolitanum]|uniref:Uncharacterized protein n=1 Tax=Penicillium cosmopolitanum TaxID=1131564 RepID=A0A9W9VQQ7_9EURO|nr:uncharacterized protein N7509_010016 [Penicillium cosmopolitanum]KAJ5387475.1 hypothetical protein N7509_010016 [Penicillium cosmopolitanum]
MVADCLGSCNIELGTLGEHPQSAVDLSSDAERSREEADGITLVQIVRCAKKSASLNPGPNFHSAQLPYIWGWQPFLMDSSQEVSQDDRRGGDKTPGKVSAGLDAKRPPPWIWPFDVAVSCSGGEPESWRLRGEHLDE